MSGPRCTANTAAADAALNRLPRYIKVAGYDLEFSLLNPLHAQRENIYGHFAPIEMKLGIQYGMPSVYKMIDTFFHELFHAIWWAYGFSEDDKQERMAAASGTAWLQIYRDNSWLAPWVAETLRSAVDNDRKPVIVTKHRSKRDNK